MGPFVVVNVIMRDVQSAWKKGEEVSKGNGDC